jgi:hypothetical protein
MLSQCVTQAALTTTVMAPETFDKTLVLKYLGLPGDYSPAPELDPIGFLNRHLFQLPPNIVQHFGSITTPKQRTLLVQIRNRRFRYVNNCPPELRFVVARNSWPDLWQGRGRSGIEVGKDERLWAQNEFLEGAQQHVGKLGNLLGDYEEEREVERVRNLRLSQTNDFLPEEEDSEDEEEEEENKNIKPPEQDTDEQVKTLFERRIRERFIYGLLDVGRKIGKKASKI